MDLTDEQNRALKPARLPDKLADGRAFLAGIEL